LEKTRRYATPPDFQRKWAEMNLQLNFLDGRLTVEYD
jgi:hypothetical protein